MTTNLKSIFFILERFELEFNSRLLLKKRENRAILYI